MANKLRLDKLEVTLKCRAQPECGLAHGKFPSTTSLPRGRVKFTLQSPLLFMLRHVSDSSHSSTSFYS